MSQADDNDQRPAPAAGGGVPALRDATGAGLLDPAGDGGDGGVVEGPGDFGATKYVHAAFFGAGLLATYLVHKSLEALWGSLAAWPAAVRALPVLLQYDEDGRVSFTLVAGLLVGVAGVVAVYRRPSIRKWADDVALELSQVTWPTRETVTNGTIIVIVASIVATIYVGLLDRFWGFVSQLIYGT